MERILASAVRCDVATEDTTYPVDKLKDIAKVVSTVPEGVKFVRKAERILQGRQKWFLKPIR